MPNKAKPKGKIQKRNPLILPALFASLFAIYFLTIFFVIFVGFITRGSALIFLPFIFFAIGLIIYSLYAIYWFYKTKEEINSLGASIPTFILFFIPIASLYWYYKYAQGYVNYVKKGSSDDTIIWSIFVIFLPPAAAYFIQKELNNFAK